MRFLYIGLLEGLIHPADLEGGHFETMRVHMAVQRIQLRHLSEVKDGNARSLAAILSGLLARGAKTVDKTLVELSSMLDEAAGHRFMDDTEYEAYSDVTDVAELIKVYDALENSGYLAQRASAIDNVRRQQGSN